MQTTEGNEKNNKKTDTTDLTDAEAAVKTKTDEAEAAFRLFGCQQSENDGRPGGGQP